MATNPLIDQGTLNRLRGNVLIVANPTLNVTAPYLGKEGIGISLEGQATLMIENMTGATTSPEPYQQARVVIHLLKTQNLADLWKKQMEASTLLGDITVYTDTTTLSNYPLANTSILSLAPLSFAGQDAGFALTLEGTYYINNDLWNLV